MYLTPEWGQLQASGTAYSGASLHPETCSLLYPAEQNSNQGQAPVSLPRSLRNRQHRQQGPLPELVPVPADRWGSSLVLREIAKK